MLGDVFGLSFFGSGGGLGRAGISFPTGRRGIGGDGLDFNTGFGDMCGGVGGVGACGVGVAPVGGGGMVGGSRVFSVGAISCIFFTVPG